MKLISYRTVALPTCNLHTYIDNTEQMKLLDTRGNVFLLFLLQNGNSDVM